VFHRSDTQGGQFAPYNKPPSLRSALRAERFVYFVPFLVPVSGCATIFGGGTSQAVSFASDPVPARFVVKSSSGLQMAQGKAPSTVELPRKNEYQIEITSPGYEPQTMVLTKGVNGWVWTNLIVGGIVGFAIDFVSGAAWKLEPALVNVSLQKGNGDDHEHMYSRIRIEDSKGKVLGERVLPLVPTAQ
jgi:hypothetical protein